MSADQLVPKGQSTIADTNHLQPKGLTMWTPDDVKARFIEAVDIERRVLVKGMPSCGNGWPIYRYDAEDRAGWDDAARADDLERWKGRKFTTSAEQSRWWEVIIEWRFLIPIERRDLMWDFAECRARGWSFSKYCEDKGLVRMTAYRRVDRVLENLARVFDLEARPLKAAADRWVLQVAGGPAIKHDIETARETSATPPAWRAEALEEIRLDCDVPTRGPTIHKPFRSEKHHDNLTSPEAVAEFSKHLSSTNDARRRSQARKREKALRGVPGEQEAA